MLLLGLMGSSESKMSLTPQVWGKTLKTAWNYWFLLVFLLIRLKCNQIQVSIPSRRTCTVTCICIFCYWSCSAFCQGKVFEVREESVAAVGHGRWTVTVVSGRNTFRFYLLSRAPASPRRQTPSSRTWLGPTDPAGACRTVGVLNFSSNDTKQRSGWKCPPVHDIKTLSTLNQPVLMTVTHTQSMTMLSSSHCYIMALHGSPRRARCRFFLK